MATKSYVLRIKKEVDTLKKTDGRLKRYIETLNHQKSEIQEAFSEMGCLEEIFPDEQERTEMFSQINLNLETLNREHKETKQEMLDYVASKNQELGEFAQSKELLFEKMILNELDPEVLNHCLDTFTLYENNQVGLEQAKEMGFYKYHRGAERS